MQRVMLAIGAAMERLLGVSVELAELGVLPA
jgi:hypothetical protein